MKHENISYNEVVYLIADFSADFGNGKTINKGFDNTGLSFQDIIFENKFEKCTLNIREINHNGFFNVECISRSKINF